MKSLIQAVAIAAALAAPVASFAQSNQPLTRAQVRADLIQLEKAGYNPATADDADYPADIQAAERRVQAQNAAAQAGVADSSGYGPSTSGSTQSGAARSSVAPSRSTDFGN